MYFQIFLFVIYFNYASANFYEILGVSRSATDFDIKQSYKKLARKWHPDKNRSPEANEHFTKINEAYEALSNPEKRKEYDAFGSISNEPRGQNGQGHFWNGGNFGNAFFDFGQSDNSESRFESTNYRHYKMDILPRSYKQPTLILLVSHFCFSCHQAMRLWGNIADQIMESGIRVTVSDLIADGHLREELRVQHVPTVVMIIDGGVKYMQSEINKETVIDFIRYSFPRDLIQTVQTNEELNYFHDSWVKDSRSKMIMTKPLDRPSFRYLAIAFKYRSEISAAFMQLDDGEKNVENIVSAYQLSNSEETVIVFHDEKTFFRNRMLPKPVDRRSRTRLSLDDIDSLVKYNHMLPFPRLLSQSVFDLACPPPSQKQRSFGFCVIAVVHSKHRANLSQSDSWQYIRSVIGEHDRGGGKIMYIFGDLQLEFLDSLKLIDSPKNSADMFLDQVILLWRQSYTSASSLFLSNPWQYSNIEMILNNWDLLSNFERAVSILKSNNQLQSKIRDSETLAELFNELDAALYIKIGYRILAYTQTISLYLYELSTEPFNLIIVILGLVLISYAYSTIKAVSAHISQETYDDKSHSNPSHVDSNPSDSPRINVPELNEELYSSLLRNLQPGRLICVLLTTKDTPTEILSLFDESVTKLNNKHVAPITLNLDLHPRWLKVLLSRMKDEADHRNVLSSITELSVNRAHSSEGVVLALNISRCYFSICPLNLLQGYYEPPRRRKTHNTVISSYDSSSSSCSSSSIDVDDDNKDSRHKSLVHSHHFFDWLCHLTEGTCRRYSLTEWPPKL